MLTLFTTIFLYLMLYLHCTDGKITILTPNSEYPFIENEYNQITWKIENGSESTPIRYVNFFLLPPVSPEENSPVIIDIVSGVSLNQKTAYWRVQNGTKGKNFKIFLKGQGIETNNQYEYMTLAESELFEIKPQRNEIVSSSKSRDRDENQATSTKSRIENQKTNRPNGLDHQLETFYKSPVLCIINVFMVLTITL
ncbi:hypothetical protein BB558_004650 [Smittium angustum]|uniref:Uncharacterized protein n=1 Tax=Smittium angustum TaxID=133377 RepID=A0A2U1J2N1_SMIAN|nr:hypothetical protein BB558_004650 [Smittium angustum]